MLFESLTTYITEGGSLYDHHEVSFDDELEAYLTRWGEVAEPHGDRPAKWWSVAVYEAWTCYGGPEEGGWYYTAGELTDHALVRVFDDRAEAQAYADKLWDAIDKDTPRHGDLRKIVRCTTEALPAMVFPSKRPYYC